MKTIFFQLNHPVDGEIKLEADHHQVFFSCRWPFDLQRDDWDQWTVMSNTFSLKDYCSLVQSLSNGNTVSIAGIHSGFLKLKKSDSTHIQLVAIDSRPRSNDEFEIEIAASLNDLLPKHAIETA